MPIIKNVIIRSAVAATVCCPSFSWSNEVGLQLEEVVVTAQKRAQSTQDIGIAITALDSDSLRELNVEYAVDVANYVSNVQVQTGFGQPYFAVRGLGINEFSGNTDSPVAIHIDDVFLSKAAQATLASFDIERVEVLKGPQGTLFGRNTTGGSVNIITKRPSKEFEAGIDLSLANYQRVDTDAYISGPLTENLLGRLSFTRKHSSEGISKNEFDGGRIGNVDSWAARGQLLWEPSDATSVSLSYTLTEDDSQPLSYGHRGAINPATGTPCAAYLDGSLRSNTQGCTNFLGYQSTNDDPFTVNTNKANQLENDGDLAILRVEHDFGRVLLTSVTGYSTFTRDQFEDTAATADRYAEINWYNDIEELTQEIRLNSTGADKLNWVAGLYYQKDKVEVVNSLALIDLANIFRSAEYVQETKAVAVFGQIDYAFNDQFELIVGLRYSEEDKELLGNAFLQDPSIEPVAPISRLTSPFLTLATTGVNPAQLDDSDLSWKLGLNYHPDDDSLVYLSATRAFKSGGFEGGFPGAEAGFNAFDSEQITAYELGLKTYLFNKTLSLNAAAFHYEYKNAQVNADVVGIPVPVTTNAEKAVYDGLELDLWWRPTLGLDIKLGVGYLDGEYGEFSSSGVSQAGNVPVNSPEFTVTSLIRYQQTVNDDIDAVFLLDAKWTDEKFLESSNSLVSIQESYTLLGARVALLSEQDNWEIALWGKNLSNTEYLTYVNDVGASFGFVLDIYGLPRTFGLTLTKTW